MLDGCCSLNAVRLHALEDTHCPGEGVWVGVVLCHVVLCCIVVRQNPRLSLCCVRATQRQSWIFGLYHSIQSEDSIWMNGWYVCGARRFHLWTMLHLSRATQCQLGTLQRL